jgi:hypothetical protein
MNSYHDAWNHIESYSFSSITHFIISVGKICFIKVVPCLNRRSSTSVKWWRNEKQDTVNSNWHRPFFYLIISLLKGTCGLNFKVIYDLGPWEGCPVKVTAQPIGALPSTRSIFCQIQQMNTSKNNFKQIFWTEQKTRKKIYNFFAGFYIFLFRSDTVFEFFTTCTG